MNELDFDDLYGENDSNNNPREEERRAFEESEKVPNFNWEDFLAGNMNADIEMSGDESDYVACDEYSSSGEDVDKEDSSSENEEDNSSVGNKSHSRRSFKGKHVLYELDESSEEEEFAEYGLNPRDIDTSDEELKW